MCTYSIEIRVDGWAIAYNEYFLAKEAYDAWKLSKTANSGHVSTIILRDGKPIGAERLMADAYEEDTKIFVLRDWTTTPGGRWIKDGPFSGEWLNKLLVEEERDFQLPMIVDMDGVEGFPSSFLHQAFLDLTVYVICKDDPSLAGMWRS